MQQGHHDVLSEVRRVLWAHWDPIGVNDEPAAFGEYDAYAASSVSRLQRGTTASDLDSYLASIEILSMGLGQRPSSSRAKAVSLLLALQAPGDSSL